MEDDEVSGTVTVCIMKPVTVEISFSLSGDALQCAIEEGGDGSVYAKITQREHRSHQGIDMEGFWNNEEQRALLCDAIDDAITRYQQSKA